jgi:hypothetical protein
LFWGACYTQLVRRVPILLFLALAACAPPRQAEAPSAPPANATCALLAAHKGWAEALASAQARWETPPPTLLAVVRQESNFQVEKQTPPLAPYGYAQADARTWSAYRSAVKRPHADRANFADAVDFIGWYFAATRARTNADYRRNLDTHYLAYSRGQNRPGKASAAARRNAAKVVGYAKAYEKDLAACPPKLK